MADDDPGANEFLMKNFLTQPVEVEMWVIVVIFVVSTLLLVDYTLSHDWTAVLFWFLGFFTYIAATWMRRRTSAR